MTLDLTLGISQSCHGLMLMLKQSLTVPCGVYVDHCRLQDCALLLQGLPSGAPPSTQEDLQTHQCREAEAEEQVGQAAYATAAAKRSRKCRQMQGELGGCMPEQALVARGGQQQQLRV
jgi:hypothetical protein